MYTLHATLDGLRGATTPTQTIYLLNQPRPRLVRAQRPMRLRRREARQIGGVA